MIRKMQFNNSWYDSNKKMIKEQIENIETNSIEFFNLNKSFNKIKGGILPHAGYAFSIYGLKTLYYYLEKSKQVVENIVIFSPSHYQLLKSNHIIYSDYEGYETPFGILNSKIKNLDLLRDDLFIKNNDAIMQEHAIEMMFPIINYYYPDSNIFPFIIPEISSINYLKKLSNSFINIIKGKLDLNKTIFLSSSDMTHYGYRFGYTPFSNTKDIEIDSIEKEVKKFDINILQEICNSNYAGIYEMINKYHPTICGIYGILLENKIINDLYNNIKGDIIAYYNSNKITGKSRDFVSYGSVIFSGGI